MTPSPQEASAFIEEAQFLWHQRFELVPGVFTPGVSDIAWLARAAGLPADLSGASVLDVGTTNAGTAFELERRGAARVVAVDIFDPDRFGVRALTDFLGSNVEYVQASVYELSSRFSRRFDLVVFWGVLYHLRHPLLALDNVRAVTGGEASLETAVCDGELPHEQRDLSLARFYRRDELSGDPSNWFAPTLKALEEWCGSAGFAVETVDAWPPGDAERAMLRLHPTVGPAEYEQLSYERPLHCTVGRRRLLSCIRHAWALRRDTRPRRREDVPPPAEPRAHAQGARDAPAAAQRVRRAARAARRLVRRR